MAKQILSDIDTLIKKFSLVTSRLEKAREMYDADHIDDGEELLDEACGTGERAMYALRNLVGRYYYPGKDRSYIKSRALAESGITCSLTEDGYLHMTFPWLMPRKRHGSTSFLAVPLYQCLEEFTKHTPGYRADGKQVLMIVTVYGPEMKDAALVDVDNYEMDFITDAVAAYYLTDDGPLQLGRYLYWGLRGKETGTHVVLLPEDAFFERAKDILEELSNSHVNRG